MPIKPPKFRKLPAKESYNKSEISNGYDPRPEFSVTAKELPEIKDWKVGEEYTIAVKVKMTRVSEEEKSETRANLKVISIGAYTS